MSFWDSCLKGNTDNLEERGIVMESLSNFVIVLHNVDSPGRCSDFVRIAVGMGFTNLAITKANAAAATKGVPAAQKLAAQKKINFLYLQDIEDVVELIQPSSIVTIAPPNYGKEIISRDKIKGMSNEKTVVIIGGSDPGLSRKELDRGLALELPVSMDIGTVGTLTLTLYFIREALGE